MNILERIQSRLGQSSEIMSRAGVSMLEGGYAAENDMATRSGGACSAAMATTAATGSRQGRTDVPDFCPNRAIYVRHRRVAAV